MNMHTMLPSNSYHSKCVWFISLHIQIHNLRKILKNTYKWFQRFELFIKIYIYNKRKKARKQKRQRKQAEQTHNLLLNILMFVCESYLFCDSWNMLSYGETKSRTSYVLLSMLTLNMNRGSMYEYTWILITDLLFEFPLRHFKQSENWKKIFSNCLLLIFW